MTIQLIETFALQTATLQDRRTSLAALGAMALATTAVASAETKTKRKRKSCNKAKKKAAALADLRCQGQVPLCESTLTAVCQPGPDVQACLDAADLCCDFLGDCDATATMACIVGAFSISPPT